MAWYHTEELRCIVFVLSAGYLQCEDVVATFHFCQFPVGGFIGVVTSSTVNKAGFHALANGVVATCAEHNVTVLARVGGVEVIYSVGHRGSVAELEAHRLVGFFDYSLSTPCLALAQVHACSYVIDVVGLLGFYSCGKLTS